MQWVKEYLHILLDVVLSGIFFAWSLVFLFWPMRMYWFLWNFGRLIPPYGQQQDSVELLRGPKSIEIYHIKSKNGINNYYMIMKIGFDVGYWLYLPLLGAFLFHTARNDVQFLANLDLPQQEVVHWNGMKYEFLWPNRSLLYNIPSPKIIRFSLICNQLTHAFCDSPLFVFPADHPVEARIWM